jgi:primary-amine oxidase
MVEYIWNYYFYQDGNIELEVRLTGILQVYCADVDEPNPFGTTVAPKTNAHYHQHIFSIRVDPMVDGLNNSLVESDVVPIPDGTGSAGNFAGNGFTIQDKVLKDQSEGARDYNFDTERRWKIINPARKHYSSGREVGYVIGVKAASARLMTREDGWAATRAAFAKKALWVIKDVEDPKGGRMWPSGKYVPQTREDPQDSVGQWVKSPGNIENEDLLVYITVGTTHIPRPEDWPV